MLTDDLSGQIIVHSLTTPEAYAFDMKRPMRTVSLDPNFAKNTARSFVCGGMAGNLVLHEKGWLGHKETVLHTGEGPIWSTRWRGNLIAWANDVVSSTCPLANYESIYDSLGCQNIRHCIANPDHFY